MKKLENYSKFILPALLWIVLSIRFYQGDLIKTLLESMKHFLGFGLYGFGLTIILNGLSVKFTKKRMTREQFIKIALWLSAFAAFGGSLDFYLGSKL